MSGIDPHEIERIGPYRVIRLHAEGGQAWIFEVEDPKFSVHRALKALKPQLGPAGEFERFRSEAQVLAALSHPYLLSPYDFGRDDATGWFYYTMAFVEGETLADRLDRGPLSLDELRRVFLPVLDGLTAVHEAGVVHRDIKPSNILISNQGHAYLADLGIMVGSDSVVKSDSGRTQTGLALGTARYMSPEQARGRRDEIAAASDVFSLGLVVYEALTGRHAYSDADLSSHSGAEILMFLGSRVFQGKDLDLAMGSAVPRPLQDFVRRACRLDPQSRFASAREMREEFEKALREVEVERGRGEGLPERLAFLAGRVSRRQAGLLGIGALALVGVFLGTSLRSEARAKVLLGRAADLDTRATALLQQMQADPELLGADVDLSKRAASFELDAARAYLADGMPAEAAERAGRAVLRYEDLCGRVDWTVQKRATRRAEELRTRVAAYDAEFLPEQARASQAAPEPWKQLQQRLDALQETAEADDSCQAAEARWEQLRAAPEIEAAAADLEQQLGAGLQQVATDLRAAAQRARERAVQTDVSHVVARERLADGDRLLAAGDDQRDEKSWFGAVENYVHARERFAQVAALGPVLAVKLDFEAREREARASGAKGLRNASRVYDHAERLLLEGDLDAAAEDYQRALRLLEAAAAHSEQDQPSRG